MSVICGGTLSKITCRLTVALLPNVSVATTLIAFVPSVSATFVLNAPLITAVGVPLIVKLATPEISSVTVPLTVMGELANS